MGLAKKYKFKEVEVKQQQKWADTGLFKFDPNAEGDVFSIDTPPPTVSGSLHMGHLFSYTQAEMIARYKRARGYNVFYPMGFDDNGLPTEKLVERENDVLGSEMDREEFVKLCLKATEKYGIQFKAFFQSLGFSFDWDLCYSTISPEAQKISQRSFLDLYKKGKIEKRLAPTLWCPKCLTSYAQAEVESKENVPSTFNDIPFRNDDGDEIVIATTRPELLPACVSLFVHPEDERYKSMIGKEFNTPLFGHKVKVRADEKADPEKGTGAVMCCTFGDKTDIEWFLGHNLDLREAIDSKGHMTAIAGEFEGLYLKKARKMILEKLDAEGLLLKQEDIVHPVNVHERCGTDVEYMSTPQWYIKILDDKQKYLDAGEKVTWWPSHMGKRYNDWVSNLEWDWCISRQRFFGVPFPVWNCQDCHGTVVAHEEDLPVDPAKMAPPTACPDCGSTNLAPEKDVMDTWATSSVTPQLNKLWGEANERQKIKLPMSLRPQAHDIIRTWAFYTIVKSVIHEDQIPWNDVMVSGFVVDPNKQKLSKKTGAESPVEIIENFGADLIRYWALGSKLGVDFSFFSQKKKRKNGQVYNEFTKENVDGGRRLVNKLWNASKFIDMQVQSHDGTEGEPETIDTWLTSRCNNMVDRVTKYLDNYEFGIARGEIEKFFWNDLCDNYLEMVKKRTYTEENTPNKAAAQYTLKTTLKKLLVLLAPYIPHITDEIYEGLYADKTSVHLEPWPEVGTTDEKAEKLGNLAVEMVALLRRYKTENAMAMNAPLKKVVFNLSDFEQNEIEDILKVVKQTCVVDEIDIEEGEFALDEVTQFEAGSGETGERQ